MANMDGLQANVNALRELHTVHEWRGVVRVDAVRAG